MKLNERHTRPEPRLKATAVLSTEFEREPPLNERIGLTPWLEEELRIFLELEIGSYRQLAEQIEVAIYLSTLFPTEAEQLKQKAPLDQVTADLQSGRNDIRDEKILKMWDSCSRFTPEKVPSFPSDIADSRLEKIRSGFSGQWGFELAAESIRLFPARAKEFMEAIHSALENLDLNTLGEDNVLDSAMDVLSLDQSLHTKFHAYALSHEGYYKSLFAKLARPQNPIPRGNKARWFATYKLLLAEEITVSPTGLLLAVERSVVGKGRSLPERSHLA